VNLITVTSFFLLQEATLLNSIIPPRYYLLRCKISVDCLWCYQRNYCIQVYTRQISFVLFVIFLIVMTIIIMNLLVSIHFFYDLLVDFFCTNQRFQRNRAFAYKDQLALWAFVGWSGGWRHHTSAGACNSWKTGNASKFKASRVRCLKCVTCPPQF